MSSISHIHRLVQTIQARTVVKPDVDAANGVQPRPRQRANPQQQAKVTQFIVERLKSIDDEDPRRRKRAFRAFLEGNMLSMFGAQALGDPSFELTLDKIQEVFETDSALSLAMERTIDVLLGATGGRDRDLQSLATALEAS